MVPHDFTPFRDALQVAYTSFRQPARRYGYRGLKIFTSLSLRFQDFQRTLAEKSIEPNIADLANGWLKSYKLDSKLEQESLNTEIDKALFDYFTKNSGAWVNRPDVKLLLQDKNLIFFPILIESKGYKGKLEKLDHTEQKKPTNFAKITTQKEIC